MDRWSGILRIPLHPSSNTFYRIGASLCLSSSSKTLTVPSANAIFFNGDRVEGTGNPVIEKLSDLQNIAEILVSKFGVSVNAWAIEASVFNGPFAVYKDFIPNLNSRGEPKSYNPILFPASTATVSLISNCLQEAKNIISKEYSTSTSASSFYQPKTFILGFSKGGTVVNQLVTEIGFLDAKSPEHPMSGEVSTIQEENQIIPRTKESLLNSITEIHYVDVGLNTAGAYITDSNVIERISKRLVEQASGIRFVLHGTPRQWCDSRRVWIRNEKDKMVCLLESEFRNNCGIFQHGKQVKSNVSWRQINKHSKMGGCYHWPASRHFQMLHNCYMSLNLHSLLNCSESSRLIPTLKNCFNKFLGESKILKFLGFMWNPLSCSFYGYCSCTGRVLCKKTMLELQQLFLLLGWPQKPRPCVTGDGVRKML